MSAISFIGLGNMGAPMAANLAAAGHDVRGFDVAGGGAEGVRSVASVQEAVNGADVVITMLPNGEIVRTVWGDIIASAARETLLIDCSTIDVASAQSVHAQASAAGLRPLDAPVSGGVGGAAAGTLTFMIGGASDAFEDAKPLFEIMGAKLVYCGDAAAGQMAKICNNMILGVSMIGVCEAFVLADKLGLSREALYQVASTSSGSCWSLNTYCPAPGVGPESPADRGYKPGFAAELMLKDLILSQNAAADADAATPMGAAAQALYQRFVDSRTGATDEADDFSAILLALAASRRAEWVEK